MLKDKQRIAI